MSAAEPYHGAGAPSGGSAAAVAASVGGHICAAGPYHGAGAPAFGDSAAAEFANAAASVGVQ